MSSTAFIVEMEEFGLPSEGDALGVHYSAGAEHPPGVPRWPPDDISVL